MNVRNFAAAACVAAGLAIVLQAEQAPAPAPAGQGGGRGAATGQLIGGTLTPKKTDERGWGWAVKASVNPATPRPFYNKAKELLFQD